MFWKCSTIPDYAVTMRFGTNLTEKALLALEEAVQECRYGRPRRSFAHRFALAYLWSRSRGDRAPFDEYWQALGADHSPWSFSVADNALLGIYQALGVGRDHQVAHRLWSEMDREMRKQKPETGNPETRT
jgi:hypothetical protein